MEGILEIAIRELEFKDLENYFYWNLPDREFHKYNGPYFKKRTKEELGVFIEELKESCLKGDKNVLKNKKMIVNAKTDELIGELNWYWKSEETLWLEIGIVIFNENYWGKGIGYKGLKMWIDEVFVEKPEIVRIGLTTWSGNERMIGLAEKMGFALEAIYRKARIVDGMYYDSVSYGLLREEWKQIVENMD